MSDSPMLDFGLGETADAIRETTARYAADRIAPKAAEIDATNTFPRELWPEMGELGLHGITVEEEWGGAGLGYLEHVVAMEETSRLGLDRLDLRAHSNPALDPPRPPKRSANTAEADPRRTRRRARMSERARGPMSSAAVARETHYDRYCAQRTSSGSQTPPHRGGGCRSSQTDRSRAPAESRLSH